MKSILLFLAMLAACILWSADLSLAQCPEDPNDHGICDTLYVEVYPPDTLISCLGHLVRVPFYVTHDVPDPIIDSIGGFVIPLCFEHSNPDKYCSLSGYWNNINLYPQPDLDRSIFRHFIEGEDTLIHNWMMDLSQQGMGLEWDERILKLEYGDSDWWLFLSSISSKDRLFQEGSRVLLATMTLKVEDTMTICIDTCNCCGCDYLAFGTAGGQIYIPRDNMPYCFSLSLPSVGDVNADGLINLGDLVYLINYLFRGGPALHPVTGDCNCDGVVDLGDVVYLISYLYRGGPPPGCS